MSALTSPIGPRSFTLSSVAERVSFETKHGGSEIKGLRVLKVTVKWRGSSFCLRPCPLLLHRRAGLFPGRQPYDMLCPAAGLPPGIPEVFTGLAAGLHSDP